ncbi:MAG: DNA glycosylase AlkZ-like family protein, partial [Dehalococcoidia bacterium]
PRRKFDQVIDILSRGVAPRQGRGTAYIHRDGVNLKLKARRGARIAALTSGGAIPDNADYDVIADPEGIFVGTVNEDFAVESMAGDVFLLGNTPWRIRRVESGRVRVEDAQGAAPTIPFWLGEAPGRTRELADEVSDIREELAEKLDSPEQAVKWLIDESEIEEETARQVVEYLLEGQRILGGVPTCQKIYAERFFDESGGTQVIIHSPFGTRINRAWGMALRKQICRSFDFELQAAATDDGINFSLGPNLSFPLSDVFHLLSSRTVERVLTQAALQAPLFQTRWRWNSTRALAVLRHTGGRKVPPPLQRMRADDLLAAVFPAQLQCQDNAPRGGDIEVPDHPLVFETVRDCLTEAMDLEGLTEVLKRIEGERIEVYARDTTQPSVFSHQILNAMPYAFLDDAPLEERRSRAVALRRALPEDARDLGSLDAKAISAAAEDAWPRFRDAEELHDALLTLGMLTQSDVEAPPEGTTPEELQTWFQQLVDEGRASMVRRPDGPYAWTATEVATRVIAAFPEATLEPNPPERFLDQGPILREEALLALVRGRVECTGPFTPSELAQTLGLDILEVESALGALEADGLVLRGSFRPGGSTEEYCDRRILARIHRATISRLRREIEPVSQAIFMRFLFRWQHVESSSRLRRETGLLEAVEQLQGFEAAAGAWEPHILSARVTDYSPSSLDNLCFGGEVVWGRMARRRPSPEPVVSKTGLSRNGPLTLGLREDLEWLLDELPPETDKLSGAAKDVLKVLSSRGASFLPDIVRESRRLPSEVENALWQLVAAGRATADGFVPLRRMVAGTPLSSRRNGRLRRRARNRRPTTRWSLLQPGDPSPNAVESRSFQLLKRYGIVLPELLAREPMAPPWRELLYIYRRAEARGEIRGGRFVAGFVGEQFALPEAIDMLRSLKKSEPTGELISISACDPLNVVGILTPGARVPAVLGNTTVFRDGVPICSTVGGNLVEQTPLSDSLREKLRSLGLLSPTVPVPS